MNIQKQLKPTTENFRKLMQNVHIFTFWEDFSINKILFLRISGQNKLMSAKRVSYLVSKYQYVIISKMMFI